MQEFDFYLYTLNETGNNRCFASPIAEDQIFEKGLPTEALAGEFIKGQDQATVENFQQNPVFVQFLHWAIAQHIRDCPGFKAEAERRQDGLMRLIDLRCLPLQGDIPDEDIIGLVEVKGGQAVKFHGLDSYQVFTDKGFMRIDPWLYEKYLQELLVQVEKSRDSNAV